MIYKNIKINKRKSGKFELISPINGTRRIFNTLEMAKNYIDNTIIIDSNANAMMR